jgi:hypothetical protein
VRSPRWILTNHGTVGLEDAINTRIGPGLEGAQLDSKQAGVTIAAVKT